MPNDCLNDLLINATKETIQQIVKCHFTKNKDGDYFFDFNTVIKEPKLKRDCPIKYQNKPDEIKRIKQNAKEHPDWYNDDRSWFDWYHWRVDNWGTKWNSYDITYSEEDLQDFIDSEEISICFSTAWSPCVEIINKLIDVYRGANIEYSYYEPGCTLAGGYEYGHWYDIDWNDKDEDFRQWTIDHGYESEEHYDEMDASEFFDDNIESLTVNRIVKRDDWGEGETLTHRVDVYFNETEHILTVSWRECEGLNHAWACPDISVNIPGKIKSQIKAILKEEK